MLTTIIVDDETSAIENLTWELNKYCVDVQVLDTFTNPIDAISAINYLKPNCVFLDIEMPQMDGFQLLQKLNFRDFDLIITTAYNQYAIQAFKENAIDYLLKPIDSEELIRAIDKSKKNHTTNNLGFELEEMVETIKLHQNKTEGKRIPLAMSDRVMMVNSSEILCCLSDGNYTNIFMKNGSKHFLSKSIKYIETLLPKDEFMRVHKSYIVNINQITTYFRGDGGEIVLTNNQTIPVSRSHKQDVLYALRIKKV